MANVGHGHPRVIEALSVQSGRLLHAMGDVHPAQVKVALLEALVARFPGGGPARAVLGSSGTDAVETALKTAMISTGRSGVVAFEGAYHGLGLGALDATWRPCFREPFQARLPGCSVFARYGDAPVLVFLLLERLTGSGARAALVALLFGLHPLHVESVAWVAERKDVLCTLFWLLALEAYRRYVRSPGIARYLLVALALAAGLCAMRPRSSKDSRALGPRRRLPSG